MLQKLYRLRNNLMKKEDGKLKVLVANLAETRQKDIDRGRGLIAEHFRAKIDVLPWKLDANFEWTKDNIIKSMADQFDMPSWAWHALENGREINKEIEKYRDNFIYQIKGCNINCPWCYVDEINKNGLPGDYSEWFSIPEIIDTFEKTRAERKNSKEGELNRIRPSGGEATIVIEQWLENLKELEKRNLSKEIFVQNDSNLTTGHFLDDLERKGEIEPNILQKIGEYKNLGLLASFKGTDEKNFTENTRADGKLIEESIYSFKKYVKAGIDTYPFFYNPNPDTLESFLERLAKEVGDNVFLKSRVFRLKIYDPLKLRFGSQEKVEAYIKELNENYLKAEEKMREIMHKKFGLEYKSGLRVGIKLGN